jgi:EAL and modified HD-GYP domain-containing signal transduction protein
MDRCVVRRAIKETKTGKIKGYELLFQGGDDSFYDQPETSTADTITTFLTNNSSKFVNDKTMFITFTPSLLFRNVPKLFEPDKMVIQLDENLVVHPLSKVFIKKYRNAGYQFALNDFRFSLNYMELLDDVSYVRLNLKKWSKRKGSQEKDSLENIIGMVQSMNKQCIAVGVDTQELYDLGLKLNFDYMEGDYIASTLVNKVDKVSYLQGNFFQLLVELSQEEPDIDKMEEIVSRDAGLTFAILKLVNSAYFALRRRTASVKQALVTMGIGQLRQWVYMLSFEPTKNPAAEELLKISFLRAKFASELVPHITDCPISVHEAYMMGMFSTMEYMVDASMEEILEEIPLSDAVKQALISQDGVAGELYQLILNYERADWKMSKAFAESLDISTALLSQIYVDCVDDVNMVWNSLTQEYVRKGEKSLFSDAFEEKKSERLEDLFR